MTNINWQRYFSNRETLILFSRDFKSRVLHVCFDFQVLEIRQSTPPFCRLFKEEGAVDSVRLIGLGHCQIVC